MNKSDMRLILIILVLSVIGVILLFYVKKNESNENKMALVYFENNKILEIDLTHHDEKEYTVSGYNGDVLIKTSYGKIKVEQENSPLNLCSKQGYISSSYESIVCLPNKIVIKIKHKEDIDTIVR